jgi:hypothetical protein
VARSFQVELVVPEERVVVAAAALHFLRLVVQVVRVQVVLH